ncbi:MAG: glycosyltransferase family 2 protein [Anaerolineae bacterium]|nr:glycosyltransferase family 2 protein [Anaerolineae bacterium]
MPLSQTGAETEVDMSISVIILNWNAAEDTLHCIQAIDTWHTLKPSLWIVDNASSDGSPDIIAREAPHVHLIRNATNQGFAGGNNRGIEAALRENRAPLLLLNNDASIAESAVVTLLETLDSDPGIGFVGPLLYSESAPPQLLSAGGRSPIHHHHSHITALPQSEAVFSVEYVPGTVLLVNPAALKVAGLLHEDYFFSTEVAELCMRAARHGYRSVINPHARATHALEARPSQLRKTLYAYYIIRNRFLVMRDLKPQPLLGFYVAWTLYSVALTLKLRLTGDKQAAQAIWLGLQDGLQGRFGGQNERVLARCLPEGSAKG